MTKNVVKLLEVFKQKLKLDIKDLCESIEQESWKYILEIKEQP